MLGISLPYKLEARFKSYCDKHDLQYSSVTRKLIEEFLEEVEEDADSHRILA